eukprot:SAG11_NODE_15338_length_581_cov_1.599585_1_plen_54_part_01
MKQQALVVRDVGRVDRSVHDVNQLAHNLDARQHRGGINMLMMAAPRVMGYTKGG